MSKHTHTSKRIGMAWPVFLIILILLLLPLIGAQIRSVLARPNFVRGNSWRLVWDDEFNSSTLDTTKWTPLTGGDHYTPVTSEYYAPDDTYIQNGLVLKSERRSYNGFDYTSGGVSSYDKFSLLYGKIEWRAQLASGRGLWPALWLMPENGGQQFEIDMMELLGDNPNSIFMTHHWQDQYNGTKFTGPNFSAGFHTFDLQWTPRKLEWLVDGVIKKTATTNIPNIPMFMYMNTAIGAQGTWPGPPDKTTVFPQYTTISYVRVYQPLSQNNSHVQGRLSTTPHSVNLTNPRTADWVNWGLHNAASIDREKNVAQAISSYTSIGNSPYNESGGGGSTLKWTDGTPDIRAVNDGVGVVVCRANDGFQFTVPASITFRTLRVYVNVWRAQGQFSASFNNGNVLYNSVALNNSAGSTAGMYTLTYNTVSAGQSLTVKWTMQSGSGCIVLQAATLQ